ncbi:hypothetical protein O181_000158 [Austropuccinia psidii MF-1]|uniref:Uncharacterized protein n=1 Tax=Austropuccinia psidii MF-1 TaxID=1389203 RepID=A0A9Q3B819_9BASI|nr:hypothetical protein [Austropuccinia psidii MF-1]
MIGKPRKYALGCMEYSFSYAKDIWDKSHVTPYFKMGDLVPVFTTTLNNIKGCKMLKESLLGNFVIKDFHGENSAELSAERRNKHPKLPVILRQPFTAGYSIKFPLRNTASKNIPPVEPSGTNKITEVVKEIEMRSRR